ncbi:MAG: KamA family radical SAM protein [Candidatus Uhrbacteria bacterium]
MELWQQELQQCVRTLDQLEHFVATGDRDEMNRVLANMRLSITPHTLKLIDFSNMADPLLLMAVPQAKELSITPEEMSDPIGDETKSPVPFLTHRYPDRVLIYATFSCSHYCRFCFRREKTGAATPGPSTHDMDVIEQYLVAHPEVDEVILTGGDPLTLLDAQIEDWLVRLRRVPTINRIRFHTRVPVNLPSRITDNLIEIFRRHQDATHPIYVVTHFNHAREIAKENVEAIAKFVNAGVVVRNQSVLLRGINDDTATLTTLFKTLTNVRVVPYYLHQLDLARGTNHFRVPIAQGIDLMRRLQGTVTGIALPRYMLDLPGGKGKVPLAHPFIRPSQVSPPHREEGSGVVDAHGLDWTADSPFGETVQYREPSI